MDSVAERPSRGLLYPALGALLALGAPVGLLLVRSIATQSLPTWRWAADELLSGHFIYAYVTLSNAVAFVILGYWLGRKEDRLHALSTTDSLTGLCNRRCFLDRLESEVFRTRRYGRSAALLLIDVDGLKRINDDGGHAAGDRALGAVADSIRASLRSTDVAARYGGDEFVILLPETSGSEALALAERIRATLKRRAREVSISIGIADHYPGEQPKQLLQSADAALYEAKRRGRDCAVLAQEVHSELVREAAARMSRQ